MGKKAYRIPTLQVYGALENLTRSLAPLRRFSPSVELSLPVSDRNAKQQFNEVDPAIILNRLSEIPITTWSYKAEGKNVRHIGPMAQDFSAAFGVGADDKHIHQIDASGVAFAAIQALHQMIQERDAQIDELRAEIKALKDQSKQ